MREHGGVVARAALESVGCRSADVDRAIRRGDVFRVRNGWYATHDAPADVVRAVRVGGMATAATVARVRGLWVADDPRLHVRVRYSTGRLFAPHDRSQPLDRVRDRVCVHYSRRGPFDRAVDPLTVALAEMFACTDVARAIASVDSALETGNLSLQHLDLIRAWMPPSRRVMLDRADADAQSGIETAVRLFLRSRRIRHRLQVAIDGVGRVDILVGDRLVIEVDGRTFHTGTAFDEDRRRDFELVTRGYLVLRLSYRQVVHDWERTRAGILALVDRNEHLWSGHGPYAAIPTRAVRVEENA
ncbi:endonuclease domain-containing protein [Agromyces humi]|uniref:endonuclease domain-containing protein n=1 Tax=Agromyces humi TaxID=1766800 RepID=UPI0038B3A5CE